MATILVSLVGEQPAPNVLPILHYCPSRVILVHTSRTAQVAARIADVLGGDLVIRPFCSTDPYRVSEIKAALERYLANPQLAGAEYIFNLTGGTKIMGYAALETARQLRAPAFYYQTEDNQNLIHPYRFDPAGLLVCDPPIPVLATLTIDQFLRLYVGKYSTGSFRNDFERSVAEALGSLGSEYESLTNVILGPNVEVDWILRYLNLIAVGEVKAHATKSAGIDQLNSATEQRMLGTYTKKFLLSSRDLHQNDADLVKASRITPLILTSGAQGSLSDADAEKLIRAIRSAMEPKP